MSAVTVHRLVLLIGVILIVLSAFGVQFGPASVFELGVAIAFGSFLVA